MKNNRLFQLITNSCTLKEFETLFLQYVQHEEGNKKNLGILYSFCTTGLKKDLGTFFDIEEKGSDWYDEMTILQTTIKHGRTDILDFLIKNGANTEYAFHDAVHHPAAFLHLRNKLGTKALQQAINKKADKSEFTLFDLVVFSDKPETLDIMLHAEFSEAVSVAMTKIIRPLAYLGPLHSITATQLMSVISNYPFGTIKKLFNVCNPPTIKDASDYNYRGGFLFQLRNNNKHLTPENILALEQQYEDILVVANENIKKNPQAFLQAVINLIPKDYREICNHVYWIGVLAKTLAVIGQGTEEKCNRDQIDVLLGRVHFAKYAASNGAELGSLFDAINVWGKIKSHQPFMTQMKRFISSTIDANLVTNNKNAQEEKHIQSAVKIEPQEALLQQLLRPIQALLQLGEMLFVQTEHPYDDERLHPQESEKLQEKRQAHYAPPDSPIHVGVNTVEQIEVKEPLPTHTSSSISNSKV